MGAGIDSPIAEVVSRLGDVRAAWRRQLGTRRHAAGFPARRSLVTVVEHLSAALFPGRLGGFAGPESQEDMFVADRLGRALAGLEAQIREELAYWQEESAASFDGEQAAQIAALFAGALPRIRELVDSDVDAAFLGDPAARSVDEILVCYPGAIASLHHRIAHELDSLGVPIVARIISELANERTGIDIHPGATIGPSFFIDHGTGVVIGETAIIGARVRLYQHVTLGARSPLGAATHSPRNRFARHPIVGDDVVIYAGATILGPVEIGARSTIGGNVWLLDHVPHDSVVTQPEARVLPSVDAETVRETLVSGEA